MAPQTRCPRCRAKGSGIPAVGLVWFPPVQSCLAQAAFSGARFRRPGAEIAAWRRSCLAGLEPNSPNVRFVNRPRFPSLLLISFGGAEVRAMARRMCWFAAAAPSGGARVELKRRLFEVSLNALLETITRTRRPAPRQTPTRRLKTTLSVTGLSGRIQTEPDP